MSDTNALFLEGYTLYTQGREAEALDCFDAVIEAAPDYWQARNNRAVLLQNAQRYEDALIDVDYLLKLDAVNAGTYAMRGRIMLRLNRFADALACYVRVRELDPTYALDVYEEAFCRLSLGDYATGWLLHEHRWQTQSMRATTMQLQQRGYSQPLWLGQEPLAGKTIFLWPEQGHGDTLQFCRYVHVVQRMGAKVILAANHAMLRLLKESFVHPDITVVLDLMGSPYAFDFHCPLMSLPLACGTGDLAKIPVDFPYLFPQAGDVRRYADHLTHQALRVGLVWAGGPRPNQPELQSIDTARSLRLTQFAPLLDLARTQAVQFFSLQLGSPAAQLQEQQGLPIIDLTADLSDWADTAALVANLDLVISCDTAVAHLAAAMAKPTWILSRFNGCWRWLAERDDSPWYPTVRLFRQATRGDWAGVVEAVVAALRADRPLANALDSADRYNDVGLAQFAAQRYVEAAASFSQAIAFAPQRVDSYVSRSATRLQLQDYSDAIADADVALRLDPRSAKALNNRGLAYYEQERLAQALASYAQALTLDPDNHSAQWNQSLALLRAGNFELGWPRYERRLEGSLSQPLQRAKYDKPRFLAAATAQNLAGKTILLWPEQGHGDVMQFCRYAHELKTLGATVILEVYPSLLRLLEIAFTNTGIRIALDGAVHHSEFDFHLPLLSLPLVCGTNSLDKIPANTSYLFAAPQEAQAWQDRLTLSGLYSGLRVGLVWAGGHRPHQPIDARVDAARSLRFEQFAPLAALTRTKNVQFFSLQVGEPAKQIREAPDFPIIDLTADLHDWADTAALIANLDFVIACDTAVAHLAAAMGKPTWVLSRFNGCWRWLQDRDDSPWYPTVRLFRQKMRGDWATVIAEVAAALSSYNA